jgi:[glutamine synthetase] adenylyltransferase / [glutamine synthetase]-adenylyl-L-tyrosine phosphorylase
MGMVAAIDTVAEVHRKRLRAMALAGPDPLGAVRRLERVATGAPEAFARMAGSAALAQMLAAVASHSEFLSAEVVRHPEWLEQLPARGDLHRVVSAEEYVAELEASAGAGPLAAELAAYRRRQLLRILIRDVQQFGTLGEVTEEISNLADAILEFALKRTRRALRAVYPGMGEAPFTVISLGKLGGSELNYSSDIDLMYVYSGDACAGAGITPKELFSKLAHQLTELLSAPGPHGSCYRVDLRLRPEGTNGEICLPLEAAQAYYSGRARDWELQMFIKARVSAGDRALGRALLEFVEPLTYQSSTDFGAIEAVSEARVRISEKVTRRRAMSTSRFRHPERTALDVKLAPGGIRDIEFLVQCLQRLHGGREPWVRHGGTQLALFRLHNKGLLSSLEYSRLAAAYGFLRTLEHRLQVVADRQTHALPAGGEELAILERQLPMMQGAGGTEPLALQLAQHLGQVREIYQRVIHAQTWQAPELAAEAAVARETPSNLLRSLELKAPGLAAAAARSSLERGRAAFEHFIERVLPHAEWLAWLDTDGELVGWVADLFEHSPYFAEQLNRKPELIEVLRRVRAGEAVVDAEAVDPAALRRHYVRAMLAIQVRSICTAQPVFDTLAETSALADSVIAAAYQLAIEETLQAHPPAAGDYRPSNQMMLIALGRLGMLEFDLGSDADLLFVLPDGDAGEIVFWTRVANRTIDILMAYTGEGVIFTVDTRLRPSGREGDLVRTESAYRNYFAHAAEAWEGITYMKSRAVAGDAERATKFLHEIQAVDWERYGQEGRSRHELRRMRRRLEDEQGGANPLKASQGGYYDIDFILMYLRLKGAGVFFRVLNTPARIEVLRKMGHLTREDAAFLNDAAVFYRAVDHALRLTSGHAEGNLPGAPRQMEILTNLVRRWTPPHLHGQPLPVELKQIQAKTRALFNKLFGAE